ncbi:6-carboxytetrahydropterin synthase QueD [Mesoaciditoga lauensis]|uniref:6-carboxytetrahydropterin synthase QueD n=1 Tax=Mesoaciditoga lauensis TaxID=1495039 RepID=UPI00055D74FC|nr:6-carboxytetrahydropterin synthase QueD [Mesoaciditoga lauensis]
MEIFVSKEFKFDAAHNLIKYHGKCEKLHGHTYKLRVTLNGKPNEEGMVYDFVELKRIVNERVISKLDHSYINDLIEQPTAENIAVWIWEQLSEILKGKNHALYEVRVWETETAFVTYRGSDDGKKE